MVNALVKPGRISASRRPSRRSMRTQKEWNVDRTGAASRSGLFSRPSTRSRISSAALLVNVTARTDGPGTRCALTRWAMRWVITLVLPLPAPASSRRGPSTCSAAARCSGFSPARKSIIFCMLRILTRGSGLAPPNPAFSSPAQDFPHPPLCPAPVLSCNLTICRHALLYSHTTGGVAGSPEGMLVDFADIEQARAGDDAAFNRVVLAYRKRIFGTIARLIGRPEDVEDVAQEVFLRLYYSLDQLRSPEVFEPWLYRLTVNASYDYLRKH